MKGAKKLGSSGGKKKAHLGKGLKNRAPAEGNRGRAFYTGHNMDAGSKKGRRA